MHPPFRSFAGCFSVALPGIYLYSGQIHAGYATSFHHEKEIFGPPLNPSAATKCRAGATISLSRGAETVKVTEETAALVAQAQSGDLEAFGRLYEYVYTDLYRYAYYQLGHAEAAEDAVQETALEAFRGIRKLKNAGAFRCWIFTILSARCNRGIRDLCRQRGQNPLEDAQLSVSDFTEKSDGAIRLYEAIADLPEEDRRLLLLATVGGFSGREIARIMGRPEGTLRSRLSRCIKKLRCVLSDDHTFVGKEDTTHENVSPR